MWHCLGWFHPTFPPSSCFLFDFPDWSTSHWENCHSVDSAGCCRNTFQSSSITLPISCGSGQPFWEPLSDVREAFWFSLVFFGVFLWVWRGADLFLFSLRLLQDRTSFAKCTAPRRRQHKFQQWRTAVKPWALAVMLKRTSLVCQHLTFLLVVYM